jgi:peptide-methionine (S)-S-oxide reductase
MQQLIRRRPGVLSTRVGYSGGDVPNATYRNHGTYAEAIEIVFNPDETTLKGAEIQISVPSPRPK